MRLWLSLTAVLALGCSLVGSNTGIEQARANLRAVDTFHDFEIAKRASASGLSAMEGLHSKAPENEQLMMALVRGWVTQTELFTLDDFEHAQARGNASEVIYHRQRVASGFARARLWSLEWLTERAFGIELNAPLNELEAAVANEFSSKKDAEPLLWLGHALLGAELAQAGRGSQLRLAAAEVILKHSIELNESLLFARAHALLGHYYAVRAKPDWRGSRRHFSRAEALAGTQYLLTHFYRATAYHCLRGDQNAFQTTLDEVLKVNDPAAAVRLQNASAKRRAQRWLLTPRLWQVCGFSPSDS